MSSERWAPIEGWPYEVSSSGRVRRVSAAKGTRPKRPLTPWGGGSNKENACVTLSDRGRRETRMVAELVAAAFLDAPPERIVGSWWPPVLDHIDGDRFNNDVTNLEWVDRWTRNSRRYRRRYAR